MYKYVYIYKCNKEGYDGSKLYSRESELSRKRVVDKVRRLSSRVATEAEGFRGGTIRGAAESRRQPPARDHIQNTHGYT